MNKWLDKLVELKNKGYFNNDILSLDYQQGQDLFLQGKAAFVFGNDTFFPSWVKQDAEQNDYEAELAIIIGTTAKNVSEAEALDYVYGYCNANDLSARDLQFRTNQWLLGKCLDGFNPIGPYLVTSEEVGNPNDLRIQAIVNGELRQNSNTADMIFNCKEIISYVTKYMTLKPGDLILTGTPEGVVFGYPKEKQIWLKSGDVVSIEIEKLGVLTNDIAAGQQILIQGNAKHSIRALEDSVVLEIFSPVREDIIASLTK